MTWMSGAPGALEWHPGPGAEELVRRRAQLQVLSAHLLERERGLATTFSPSMMVNTYGGRLVIRRNSKVNPHRAADGTRSLPAGWRVAGRSGNVWPL